MTTTTARTDADHGGSSATSGAETSAIETTAAMVSTDTALNKGTQAARPPALRTLQRVSNGLRRYQRWNK